MAIQHIIILCLSIQASEKNIISAFPVHSRTLLPAFGVNHNSVVTNKWNTKNGRGYRAQRMAVGGSYGKGADIWPPTNDTPIQLTDSFPDGKLPPEVKHIFEQQQRILGGAPVESMTATVVTDTNNNNNNKGTKRRWQGLFPRGVSRIVRRAARKEEERQIAAQRIDGVPIMVALAVVAFIQPIDILLVTFLSGYFCLLTLWARSPADNGSGVPSLPALPPQGHVPSMISNPLGYGISHSVEYDRWLKLGVFTGLIAPVLWIGHALWRISSGGAAGVNETAALAAVKVAARPLFMLCCQGISENISRRFCSLIMPLPIRILIPVAYNAIRLAYLWRWTLAPDPGPFLGKWGRVLAIANFVYWSVNLFAFLLPVAVMRYMRAHFFCVEAQQVTTRGGMEESLGLTSYTYL